ncbi:hypothetical protein CHL78_007140 [Romboutsia weinsteinii]|uniref:Uncharacterized protein n=1 Tax=Romboutsia weinsteinii TaxID=2020949 RepID=A0A371J5K5_9FIRM|nr:hypothetical protein [Romboutsia weinsteinii]RDY28070.1 hypothetical protein CHL78_007140 [Romboutsia weinsteinii]
MQSKNLYRLIFSIVLTLIMFNIFQSNILMTIQQSGKSLTLLLVAVIGLVVHIVHDSIDE